MGGPMAWKPAYDLAGRWLDRLSGVATRATVSGSLRRKRPRVNDLDLLLETNGEEGWQAVIRLAREAGAHPLQAGKQLARFFLPEEKIQLDLYRAYPAVEDMFEDRPANWGMRLLVTTGSAAHNIELAKTAQRAGLAFQPYEGLRRPDGTYVDTEEEGAVFAALGLDWVEPEAREITENAETLKG